MIRLSRGKKIQRNTYDDDSARQSQQPRRSSVNESRVGQRTSNVQRNTSTSSASPRANTRVNQTQQNANEHASSVNSENLLVGLKWFLFTFLLVATMLCIGFGFYSLTNYVMTHEYFETKVITISGIERFTEEEILLLSGIQENMNVFEVSINDAQTRMLQNPWIESVQITRYIPDSFSIIVDEREPMFWLLQGSQPYYVDISGNIIAPVESANFTSLPILELGQGPEEALQILPDFLNYLQSNNPLPFDFREVAWFRLSAGNGIEMFYEEKQVVIAVDIEDFEINLQLLGYAIEDLENRNEFEQVAEIHAANGQVWFDNK